MACLREPLRLFAFLSRLTELELTWVPRLPRVSRQESEFLPEGCHMVAKPHRTVIARLNADFESVRGEPFQYFYCPILHVDENVQLTRGHIIPKSLGGKSTVLQRADVDNRFGSFFEAEALDAIKLGLDGDPLEFVLNGNPLALKKLGRRYKFSAHFEGAEHSVRISPRKIGDHVGWFVQAHGDEKEPKVVKALSTESASVSAELDARSSILATSLRASHLCWFDKCGYRYVFSEEGILVAWILRSFYEMFASQQNAPNQAKQGSLISDRVKAAVNDYCLQFANMIRPCPSSMVEALPEDFRRGSPDTGRFIALWDEDQIYGRISLVKLGEQYIAIMTPCLLDPRGWALLDLVSDLELTYSFAKFDDNAGVCTVDPPNGQTLVWPSTDGANNGLPPKSIREAAHLVIRSGRMTTPGQ